MIHPDSTVTEAPVLNPSKPHPIHLVVHLYPLLQRSPTFLAPGTSFMEGSFSMDQGGGGMVQEVMQLMGSGT